ncbi:MAG: type II toxin-antitoxin system Phd/YefM family antitoxin [Verrucomicrobiae bacterium]|nr:type II toxin-antitoxin system Phd/YefM family antitoxin [Verrucomicrobiae bacterium]
MTSTYSITEAQAKLPSLVKKAEDRPIVITRRDKVVGYLLSPERMESILETLEIMADPKAMKAIRDAEAGKGKYYPLSILDELDEK